MIKRVSLSSIAQMAGVSKPVVYTVLNNREGNGIRVGPRTREKILALSRELGYVAPKSAKELFSGRSDNIGVIVHKNVTPYSDFVGYFQQESLRRNLEITVYITNDDEELEEHYLNSARDGRVDAVVTTAMLDGSAERYQRFAGPPYNLKILYYGDVTVPGVPSIHFDDMAAGRLAARHLTEIGCRRPAFFGAIRNTPREKGFIGYFKKQGLSVPPSIITSKREPGHSFLETTAFTLEFLKRDHLPDGVFVAHDLLAAVMIVEAVKMGIRIPEDIKILGLGKAEIGLYTTPTLSTIDVNIPVMAKKAMEKIVGMIEGKPVKPFHTRTPVSLVARESTSVRKR